MNKRRLRRGRIVAQVLEPEVVFRKQRLELILPFGRTFGGPPGTAAPTEVRDREVEQKRFERKAFERLVAPGEFHPFLAVARIVDGGGAEARESAHDGAHEEPEAERQPRSGGVGDGPRGGTRSGADHGRLTFVDRVDGEVPVALHAADDLAVHARAVQTVYRQEARRERAEAVGGVRREGRLRVLDDVGLVLEEPEALRHRDRLILE